MVPTAMVQSVRRVMELLSQTIAVLSMVTGVTSQNKALKPLKRSRAERLEEKVLWVKLGLTVLRGRNHQEDSV